MSVAGHLAALTGLVSLGQLALDGTEIKANASKHKPKPLASAKQDDAQTLAIEKAEAAARALQRCSRQPQAAGPAECHRSRQP